jgi:hypothetical protein
MKVYAVWALALALVATACGAGEPASRDGAAAPAGAWQELPAPPLGPRENALGLWTGREVLLVGGSDASPCPPTAECNAPDVSPLADGAAFDPRTGAWREIADAPVPFGWAEGVVLGQTAYVWIPGSPGRPGAERAFLAYRIEEDRWERLPPPTEQEHQYRIVAAGDRVIAYSGTDELGEIPDLVFDAETAAWSELPPDPLSPSFDRFMTWSGRELVLFEHELVPQPGSDKPAVTRAAALDPPTGSWRRLPDSEILGAEPWVAVGTRLVNPMLGGADGGEVNNWGRTYPNGGILDPERGEWSELPSPPAGEDEFGSGVVTAAGGHFFGHRGWVLDTASETWIEIPPLTGDENVYGRTIVSAGDELVVFGGVRWDEGLEGTLLADAWAWRP